MLPITTPEATTRLARKSSIWFLIGSGNSPITALACRASYCSILLVEELGPALLLFSWRDSPLITARNPNLSLQFTQLLKWLLLWLSLTTPRCVLTQLWNIATVLSWSIMKQFTTFVDGIST